MELLFVISVRNRGNNSHGLRKVDATEALIAMNDA